MGQSLFIIPVDGDRERYRDLLLLADEKWDMVERYMNRGDMFAAFDAGEAASDPHNALGCVIVTDEGVDGKGSRIAEVKSLAVAEEFQRRGIGRVLLEHVAHSCSCTHDILHVGTGDSPLTVPFYEACGFTRSHTVPNFFIDHYDHPIIEAGVQLKDMVYLRRKLR